MIFGRLPVNRRLTESELEQTHVLLLYNSPTRDLKEFILKNFRKTLTTMDICNLRRRVKPKLIQNLTSAIENISTEGVVKVFRNESGKYTHVCFARYEHRYLFQKFPQVVNVDATHGTNRENYKLYQFLITDGMGVGRPVMYAFVARETSPSLEKLFLAFAELMGDVSQIQTIVMDKMAAQMRAAEVVLGCNIHLCYFHVRQSIRRHANYSLSRSLFHRLAICESTAEFHKHLNTILKVDPRFYKYLSTNWLPIQSMWAMHAQCDLLLLGNRTNNRIENANGRLKKETNHRDGLGVAINKVWLHSGRLVNEYSLLASWQLEHRLILSVPDFVKDVLYRMTSYAAKQVLCHIRHQSLRRRTLFVSDTQVNVTEGSGVVHVNLLTGECTCSFYKTKWLPCVHILSAMRRRRGFSVPIRERWTTAFNVPLETLDTTVPITPAPMDETYRLSNAVKTEMDAVQNLLGEEVNPVFQSMLDLLRAAKKSHVERVDTSVTKLNSHQPRWRKRQATTDAPDLSSGISSADSQMPSTSGQPAISTTDRFISPPKKIRVTLHTTDDET